MLGTHFFRRFRLTGLGGALKFRQQPGQFALGVHLAFQFGVGFPRSRQGKSLNAIQRHSGGRAGRKIAFRFDGAWRIVPEAPQARFGVSEEVGLPYSALSQEYSRIERPRVIKTIFIDFGNVIAFFDHQRAVRQLLSHTDLTAPELTRILYDSPLELDYERGQLSTVEYVRLGSEAAHLKCSPEQFLAAFVDIFWPNPEVCELIPKLAERHRLVLASNTNDAHYRKYCEQFASEIGKFSAKCPSHFAGSRKPNEAYFAYCQQFAEANPEECLFLDDLRVNVEAARNFGWQAIEYRPGQDLAGQLTKLNVL
jgi:putative hydrolase of the HAD superfamily